MAYYFGFLPSTELNTALDEANSLVKNALIKNTDDSLARHSLDSHRNHITQLVKNELIDTMLVQIVASLPDESERKAQLQKICQTIATTTDKLLKTILGKASNAEVMPSFEFLEKKTLFVDLEGKQRVGFAINDRLGHELEQCFNAIQSGNTADTPNNVAKLANLLSELTEACMQHFLIDFTKTLNLGMLKRSTIPVAQSVINKVSNVALHKLLPQMPQEGLERIVSHYQPLIYQK